MKLKRRLDEPSTWLGIIVAVIGVLFGAETFPTDPVLAGLGIAAAAGGAGAALKKDPGSPE